MDSAIDSIVTRVLEALPDDLSARWIIGLIAVAIGLIVFSYPDKVKEWLGLGIQALEKTFSYFERYRKRAKKLEIEGAINHNLRRIARDNPGFQVNTVSLEYIDSSVTRQAFIENNKVIVRVKHDDPECENIAHCVYWFVSTSLLPVAKSYLAKKARTAIDIFVSAIVLQSHRPSTRDAFGRLYAHRLAGDPESKVQGLIEDFRLIHDGNYFFPILLQELFHLQEKLFVGSRRDQVAIEFNQIIDLLKVHSARIVGQDTRSQFVGELCKVAIVIVGKALTIDKQGSEPYVRYIQRELLPKRIETIYLVGRTDNEPIMIGVASSLTQSYELVLRRTINRRIRFVDKQDLMEPTAIFVLRTREIAMIP